MFGLPGWHGFDMNILDLLCGAFPNLLPRLWSSISDPFSVFQCDRRKTHVAPPGGNGVSVGVRPPSALALGFFIRRGQGTNPALALLPPGTLHTMA